MKPIFKRLLSGVLSATMTVSAIPIVSAHAEESAESYDPNDSRVKKQAKAHGEY